MGGGGDKKIQTSINFSVATDEINTTNDSEKFK
jgi:hypothetical protein